MANTIDTEIMEAKAISQHTKEKERRCIADDIVEDDLDGINTKHILRKMDLRLIPMVGSTSNH